MTTATSNATSRTSASRVCHADVEMTTAAVDIATVINKSSSSTPHHQAMEMTTTSGDMGTKSNKPSLSRVRHNDDEMTTTSGDMGTKSNKPSLSRVHHNDDEMTTTSGEGGTVNNKASSSTPRHRVNEMTPASSDAGTKNNKSSLSTPRRNVRETEPTPSNRPPLSNTAVDKISTESDDGDGSSVAQPVSKHVPSSDRVVASIKNMELSTDLHSDVQRSVINPPCITVNNNAMNISDKAASPFSRQTKVTVPQLLSVKCICCNR